MAKVRSIVANVVNWRLGRVLGSRGIPSFKVRTQDKELTANAHGPNFLFFNDSTEMPAGESSQRRRGRKIEKQLVATGILGPLR